MQLGIQLLTKRAGVRVPSTSNRQMMSGWVRSANEDVAIVVGRNANWKVMRKEKRVKEERQGTGTPSHVLRLPCLNGSHSYWTTPWLICSFELSLSLLLTSSFSPPTNHATSPVKYSSLWYVLSLEHRCKHTAERWDSCFCDPWHQISTDLIWLLVA